MEDEWVWFRRKYELNYFSGTKMYLITPHLPLKNFGRLIPQIL